MMKSEDSRDAEGCTLVCCWLVWGAGFGSGAGDRVPGFISIEKHSFPYLSQKKTSVTIRGM